MPSRQSPSCAGVTRVFFCNFPDRQPLFARSPGQGTAATRRRSFQAGLIMSWYYAENGRQVGPITDADFQALLLRGAVRDETLVWTEGMANWQPYGQVRPASPTAPSLQPPVAATSGAAGEIPAASLAAGEVVCSECG